MRRPPGIPSTDATSCILSSTYQVFGDEGRLCPARQQRRGDPEERQQAQHSPLRPDRQHQLQRYCGSDQSGGGSGRDRRHPRHKESEDNRELEGQVEWVRTIPTRDLILLSNRGKAEDLFWFSFFHETYHVLYGKKSQLYIADEDSTNPEEQRADVFAAELLIPRRCDQQITGLTSDAEIIELANILGRGMYYMDAVTRISVRNSNAKCPGRAKDTGRISP